MGIYLGFSISNSVTQEKWEKIYEEALVLADKLNLADWNKFYYKGVRAYAYCRVKEQTEEECGVEKHFWLACGEYKYLKGGECFGLAREIDKKEYDKNAGPAILYELDSCSNISPSSLNKQIRIQDIKTTGGLYHFRLLAVLCFLESKLKEKIFIFGDIDKGLCESAVRIANKCLKEPIDLPARCDYTRLYEIIKTIDISDEKKLSLLVKTYLGEPDLKYKNFIEEKFDKNVIDQFWKNRFNNYAIGSYDFAVTLKEYLSYGFAFNKIFSYIMFTNTKEECIKFLESIIDIETNMNQFSKSLGITRNPKNNKVRGFSLEFRYSLFKSENRINVDNCTFDDYVSELSKYFGEEVDVRSFLEEKIKEEDEDSILSKARELHNKDNYYIFKGEENFDIILSRELMYYKTGNTIAPFLIKAIQEAAKSNKERLSDKKFKELQEKESTEQIYELIDINPNFPARDIDWFHTIDYFNSHSDALERYYPIFHMGCNDFSISNDIAKALFMNDEFYEFYKKL